MLSLNHANHHLSFYSHNRFAPGRSHHQLVEKAVSVRSNEVERSEARCAWSSVLTLSPQRQRQVPQDQGSAPQDCLLLNISGASHKK